jgi:hypothetical protein
MAGKITGLEPDVQAFVDQHGLMMATHDMVAISQAISLKRIADSFNNAGSEQGSVLWWLENLASAANAGRS